MLTFNGKTLPAGVKLIGYTLWSPEVELRTLDVPSQRGVLRTGGKIGARSLRLDLCIEANGAYEATMIAERMRIWCLSDGPAKLKIPRRDDVYLEAEVENFPAPEMDKYWEPFEMSFRCFRPEFVAERLSMDSAPGTITIGGTLSTYIGLNLTTVGSDLLDPEWTIDGHLIKLEGSVPAGVLYIDTDPVRASVTLDGDDITNMVTLESDLALMLEPGEHTITTPNNMSTFITWRDRYI